jgi:hypothetical protein
LDLGPHKPRNHSLIKVSVPALRGNEYLAAGTLQADQRAMIE